MVDFDYPEHYCESLSEAVELAVNLQAAGEYDLFRGQRHTYDIQPSILRKGVNKSEAQNSLNNFAQWVHQTPELKSLHNNPNAILAVAQHYGIKTPLLDFSYNPRIAGFFASDNGQEGKTGTIICVNKERFIKSWKDMNENVLRDKGFLLTEIIELDVKNLWRLQAQEGAFIRCHVDYSFLEMFSFMLHIYFPQTGENSEISAAKIYPKEKSHIEVLLDQYFLIDSYQERHAKLEGLFGPAIATVTEDMVKKEIESFFINDIIPTPHESWESKFTYKWLREPNEHFGSIDSVTVLLRLPLDKSINELEEFVFNFVMDILKETETRNKLIDWEVLSQNNQILFIDQEGIQTEKNEFTEFKLSEMVDVIYSGMRTLPFTNHQVSIAISRYITMANYGCYQVMNQPVGIELESGKVRGRGFCDKSKLLMSIREDFYEFIKPEKLKKSNKLTTRDLIFVARYVKSAYVFEDFITLFVEDIIPSVATVAVEGLTINLNPARIEIMDES